MSIDLRKKQVYAYLVIWDAKSYVGTQRVQFQKIRILDFLCIWALFGQPRADRSRDRPFLHSIAEENEATRKLTERGSVSRSCSSVNRHLIELLIELDLGEKRASGKLIEC